MSSRSMADTIEKMRLIRDSLIDQLNTEMAYLAANGTPKPTYSLDGQSFSWNEWRTAMLRDITQWNKDIAELSWAVGGMVTSRWSS